MRDGARKIHAQGSVVLDGRHRRVCPGTVTDAQRTDGGAFDYSWQSGTRVSFEGYPRVCASWGSGASGEADGALVLD